MLGELILIMLIFLQSVNSQLIRPNDVYVNVVRSVCSHYECNSVTLIYTNLNYSVSREIMISTNLLNLQLQFNKFYIRTILIDLQTLVTLLNKYENISNIKTSIFVFLSDSEDVKIFFTEQLSPLLLTKKPMWLIFCKNTLKIDKFLENMYIPFDSKFMVSQTSNFNKSLEIITEVYQITRGGKLKSDLFALWSPELGMYLPDLSLYKRRNNLYGNLFRVAIINDPPTSEIIFHHDKIITFSGTSSRVMNLLMETLNFTVTYVKVNSFGNVSKKNKTWTGAIGSLISNNSDIFAGMLRMTADRNKVVDFPMPLYREKFALFIKKSSKLLVWDKYVKPFNNKLWLVICCFAILIIMIITFIKLLKPYRCSHGQGIKNKLHILGDTIFKIFGVLCNQAMEQSYFNPIRIVQFVTHVTSYVVITAYSAILISSLTVYTFEPPFTDLKSLLKTRSYRMGVVKDSSDYTFFQKSTNWMIKRVFDKLLLKETYFPASAMEGLRRVCNKDRYVFMTAKIIASHFYLKGCSLMPLQVIIQAPMGLGLQKNSPYHDLFNIQLLLLRENGLLRKSIEESSQFINDDEESWTPVQFIDVLPLLLMLTSGGFLSILILCGEILVNQKIIKRVVYNIQLRLIRKRKK